MVGPGEHGQYAGAEEVGKGEMVRVTQYQNRRMKKSVISTRAIGTEALFSCWTQSRNTTWPHLTCRRSEKQRFLYSLMKRIDVLKTQ